MSIGKKKAYATSANKARRLPFLEGDQSRAMRVQTLPPRMRDVVCCGAYSQVARGVAYFLSQ
eukprot:14474350-Alexandrium_andersonii.AAC.1